MRHGNFCAIEMKILLSFGILSAPSSNTGGTPAIMAQEETLRGSLCRQAKR